MRDLPRMPGRGTTAGTLLVAAAVVTAVALLPWLGAYHAYVVALVVVQVVAVLSLNLLMGYAGQVSLGQAAFVGMGAFATAQLAAWGVPFPATVVAATAITAVAAAVVGLPALRIRGLHLAVTTLAFGLAAEVLLFARPWDPAASMGVSLPRPALLANDRTFLLVAVGALLLVLFVDRGVRASRLGRAFVAVRDREDIAAARGVPVGVTKLTAYAVSGLYAGLAGSLYAYLLERVTAEPFSVWQSLTYVAAAVVGGLGSWAGAIAAGGAFTALPELLRPVAVYAPLTGALLLALVPAVRPDGLGWLLDRPIAPRRTSPAPAPAGRTAPPAIDPAALAPPRRAIALELPLRTMLAIEGLEVSFGGLHVLSGVDLEVRRGEIAGLIGPNGAGKSTIFNVVSGYVAPTAGRVEFQHRDLVGLPAHARAAMGISRTFQHTGLSPRQSALDNVLLAQHTLADYAAVAALTRARSVRRTEAELRHRAHEALTALGLDAVADRRVDALPHLQQRLVEIAGAVAAGPRLLLLDEPAAGVHPEEAHELGDLLRDLRDALDLTLVVIEHHVPLVADLCDRVIVLAGGRVLAAGDPASVQRHPDVQRVYLGEAGTQTAIDATDREMARV